MTPRFCIQNSITDRVATPCSVAHLKEVMQSPAVQQICDRIKLLNCEYPQGGTNYDEEKARLKRQLPVITPHAKQFTNNERKNQNAIPSGLCMLDIDDIEDPTTLGQTLSADECRTHHIYLIHITASGHGLRVIGELQEGETIAAGQQRLAHLYGAPTYDSQTKDLARASFLVPMSYVLYMDEQGLEGARSADMQPLGNPPSPTAPSVPTPCRETTVPTGFISAERSGVRGERLEAKGRDGERVWSLGGGICVPQPDGSVW